MDHNALRFALEAVLSSNSLSATPLSAETSSFRCRYAHPASAPLPVGRQLFAFWDIKTTQKGARNIVRTRIFTGLRRKIGFFQMCPVSLLGGAMGGSLPAAKFFGFVVAFGSVV